MADQHAAPVRRGNRIRRAVTAPGVIWFGLPMTVWATWDAYAEGRANSIVGLTLEFLIAFVVLGLLGGHLFQWLMGRVGFPLDRTGRDGPDRPA